MQGTLLNISYTEEEKKKKDTALTVHKFTVLWHGLTEANDGEHPKRKEH